jgi:RND family efflux transporter MFP subunit
MSAVRSAPVAPVSAPASAPRSAIPRTPVVQPAPQTVQTTGAPMASWALDLHAAMLEPLRLQPSAAAGVCALASALGARRVVLGWLRSNGEVTVLARSDGQWVAPVDQAQPADAVDDAMRACLGECVDQQAGVCWPLPAGDTPQRQPRITVAHRACHAASGGALLSLPLVHDGRVLGALTLQWADAAARDRHAVDALEHLAAWMAPVLALLQVQEEPWHRRLRQQAHAWLHSDDQPERRRWRLWLPVALTAGLLLAAWPATWHVGGQARLEGAVQRVLAAPADGFIQQVHVRPGDTVKAGQPLLELADRDLQLERQRWQSQLAQHWEGHAAAQARADRAALAQHQARADEAQAQLDLVEEKLSRSRLVAPFDGVVVQGDLSQQMGAPVKQGAELITLAPQGDYRVIVEVDERDVAELRLGQTGTLALSALPWQTTPLQVTRISPVAKAVEGRNVFEVEAALSVAQPQARPGLQGQARIAVDQAPLGWQIVRRLAGSARMLWWRVMA